MATHAEKSQNTWDDAEFSYEIVEGDSPHVEVSLKQGFNEEQWLVFEEFHRHYLAEGIIHWNIDLCEIESITSQLIGLIIGFNAILLSREGVMRLIVKKGSPVAAMFKQQRLAIIMPIKEKVVVERTERRGRFGRKRRRTRAQQS